MSKAPAKKVVPIKAQVPVPTRRKSPLPANVAAIWGAFLYEGLLACSHDARRSSEILRLWMLGCDHLLAEVCAFLPAVWKQIEPRWYEKDFPGVFEYEVISPLGVNIGDYLLLNYGELPPRELVRSFIEELIADFFRSETRPSTYTRTPTGKIDC